MIKGATTLHPVVALTRATQQSVCPPVNAKIPLTAATPGGRAQRLYRFARSNSYGKAAEGDPVETRQLT
jgi:hypothetical protein